MNGFPDRVGPYLLLHRIGVGGMGVVYEARCEYAYRIVAIKFLRLQADPLDLDRFFQETLTLQRLTRATTGIAGYLDHGVMQGFYWVAIERIHGLTLRERLQRGDITRLEVLSIMLHLLKTCQVAHGEGIIHRDLKPDNVILEEAPVGAQVKLLDFGVCRNTSWA